ncbi:hypothetical protein Pcinc_004594 [Petrolisthes cinctipes]|uniref:YqaJ viral recombinase domain-containing protein n=1 Tax=Petrolisthes cinctipes TaxID=88211 RepID=A0AAE1L048_PETCI|nr:hypothetical protein Pcinc_004594 [Petrolisthes cinctipes]
MATPAQNYALQGKQLVKVGQLLPGFSKADDRNLPKVDLYMIVDFFQELRHPAMKHVKMQRSAGVDYGTDAVGYVQLRRADGICEVVGRITPEHKVSSKPYRVVVKIDETSEKVVDAKCMDCAAAEGYCKYAVAFLGWLQRRSMEKSVTSTTSYWKKARLSNVTVETKTTALETLRPNPRKKTKTEYNASGSFLTAVLENAPEGTTGLIFDHLAFKPHKGEELGIDRLLQDFLKDQIGEPDCDQFLLYCKQKMTDELCDLINKGTILQAKSPLWHAVRFSRVTASKAYDAAHSSGNINSSLVMSVIGAARLKDTDAMKRGRKLEHSVLNEVRSQLGKINPTGIFLTPGYPVMGASPDGITEDGQSIVEVKCPTTQKNFRKYVKNDGCVAAKHLAQVQMLMHIANRKQAYFCVAHPDFELTKNLKIVKVMYDPVYSEDLMLKCQNFWEKTVFLELCRVYSN